MNKYFSIQENEKDEEKSMWNMIKGLINVKLLVTPTFLLVGTSGFLISLGFFVPLFFLPDLAESYPEIDTMQANFLISIYGTVVAN